MDELADPQGTRAASAIWISTFWLALPACVSSTPRQKPSTCRRRRRSKQSNGSLWKREVRCMNLVVILILVVLLLSLQFSAIHNGYIACIRFSLFDKNCQSNAFIQDPSLQRSFMAGPCQRWTATFALWCSVHQHRFSAQSASWIPKNVRDTWVPPGGTSSACQWICFCKKGALEI